MQLWTVDYCEVWVETPFGRTHILVSGPEDGTPLFLIPGLSYGSWVSLALAREMPDTIAALRKDGLLKLRFLSKPGEVRALSRREL